MEHSRRAAKRARNREQAAARAAREEDKHRKVSQRQRNAADRRRQEVHEQQRLEEAVVRTERAEQRLQKLMLLLRAALKHIPGELDFEAMKKKIPEPVVGTDDEPFPLPRWEEYAPSAAGPVGRMFQRQRQEARMQEAEEAYARAMERYKIAEADRRRRLEALRNESDAGLSPELRAAREHNRQVEDFAQRVYGGHRHAASEYFDRVLSPLTDKLPGPKTRRFAYVPESKLLVIEWHVPETDIVPREKEYRYNADRDIVEVTRWRSLGQIRETYQNVLAQLALRGVASAFSCDPNWLVETVVFNAVVPPESTEVEASDEATDDDSGDVEGNGVEGNGVEPEGAGDPADPEVRQQAAREGTGVCLLSMYATRHQFERLELADLTDTEPLEIVRKRFRARISPFPEELAAVTPLRPYELAEPHGGDVEHECRLDLNNLSVQDLDRMVADLLEGMGYHVEVIRPEDEDCDLLATIPGPDGDERVLVHLRRVTHPAGPMDVRGILRAVRSERADSGILMITGGFDNRAFEYAAGRDVLLYDAHALLCLLHIHGLARHDEDAGTNAAASAEENADATATSAIGTIGTSGMASVPHQRVRSESPVP